jgi:hypothetical protein
VDATAINKLCSFISDKLGDEINVNFDEIDHDVAKLKTVLNHSDKILALGNEKDVVCCFQVIIAIMNTSVEVERSEGDEVIRTLIDNISASDNAKVVITVFVSVFNLLHSTKSKFEVMKGLLSYAIKTNQANLVSHFESKVIGWISSWNLNDAERRELFLLMADTLAARGDSSRELFFLAQYLSSFASGETYAQQSIDVATRAVLTAVKAPVSSFKEKHALYQTLASHNSSDATLLKLIDLLRIMCVGKVEDYLNFYNCNHDLFSKFDLCHDTLLKNMRLLGLCTLAARSTVSEESSHQLAYADIAKALEVSSDEEVEEWVVEVIFSGFLEVVMD